MNIKFFLLLAIEFYTGIVASTLVLQQKNDTFIVFASKAL